ncbi:cell division protein FtsZ [Vibrio alginolyticus]|uniref:cell division protein FtsZ n=1 Tax=Vibrio sp. B1FLJ16 TaxID=2751178 RepID=UPI0015F5A88B|nr:cell division protein FtsZ [Vibrio sp. B1FLJ16]CAD1527540.1 Cell division protein FtsZ [Vibrio sp. B1FLJ16]CAD7799123.1 Essential cell division protein that forms a contractile ring structure (Z ring) at the future cell division site. The regulation of the ring assembly controls the timing and the location of cell division. One of the functions of the FtsZ ring is to recruit other cell division proteins to the septum to produce a new cell wall between the dividing cells. Binds GTP and shows GT
MFEPMMEMSDDAVIKVVGVGGGGGNAVEHMVRESIEGVEFISVNTDAQALRKTSVGNVIQIGGDITKGLGAGANPQVGREAALEDRDRIKDSITGADMVFIAAGMGGGTGTGAAPVIAEVAKELGILTVAVVTKPFSFEGKKRLAFAEQGIDELSKHVDSLITIPNEKLLKVLGRGVTLLEAFASANDVLKNAVQGIAELITRPGMINVDFADVRTVMSEMGHAMMGSGIAKGEDRAEEAAEMAISSPLLEDIDLAGARGVLVNITAGLDMRLDEFETVGNTVKAFASDNATVVIGTSLDPDMTDEIRVTVVATGIGNEKKPDITLVAGGKAKVAPAPQAQPQQQVVTAQVEEKPAQTLQAQVQEKPAATPQPANTTVSSSASSSQGSAAPKQEKESGYLDIPAFLRRQAD